LGIRSRACSLCHNTKKAVFRDFGGKLGRVLGVLSGSSKEVKLESLTRIPVTYCRQVRYHPQTDFEFSWAAASLRKFTRAVAAAYAENLTTREILFTPCQSQSLLSAPWDH
jgi:hypothetical protein